MLRRFGDPRVPASREARREIERLFALCRRNRVPFGVVLFPDLVAQRTADDRLGFLMDRVLATCHTQEVPCLDLRPIFAPHVSGRDLWVNRLDAHPGAKAQRLAAAAIFDAFAADFEVGARPSP